MQINVRVVGFHAFVSCASIIYQMKLHAYEFASARYTAFWYLSHTKWKKVLHSWRHRSYAHACTCISYIHMMHTCMHMYVAHVYHIFPWYTHACTCISYIHVYLHAGGKRRPVHATNETYICVTHNYVYILHYIHILHYTYYTATDDMRWCSRLRTNTHDSMYNFVRCKHKHMYAYKNKTPGSQTNTAHPPNLAAGEHSYMQTYTCI